MRFMKPLTLVSLTMLSLGGASLVSSCAENRSSFFISHVVYFPPEDGCEIDVDPSGLYISQGTLDLSIKSSYSIALLLGNQLRPLGDRNTLKTETSRIQVEGIEVALSGPGGGGSYTVPASGTVNPDNSEPGYATTSFELIQSGAIKEVGNYQAEITVFGRTLGGLPIETGVFNFPIQVCRGCLAVCSPDSELVLPGCSRFYGQDYPLDCRAYPEGECPLNCG